MVVSKVSYDFTCELGSGRGGFSSWFVVGCKDKREVVSLLVGAVGGYWCTISVVGGSDSHDIALLGQKNYR